MSDNTDSLDALPVDKDGLYLQHIQDAAGKIARYIQDKTLADMQDDDLLLDGVVREVEIIGEAINNLSDEIKERHSQLPWSKAVAMRNRLVHGYFLVSPEVVWQTAVEDIPELMKELAKLSS